MAYKLTDRSWQTHGGCQWGPGVTHKTSGEGELCGSGWLHYYQDKLLAVMLNPIHAGFHDPVLWLGRAEGKKLGDHGPKWGCTKFTTTKIVQMPVVTLTQQLAFGILGSLEVYHEPSYVKWAEAWLDGSDRSVAMAWAASAAAWSPECANLRAWAASVAALGATKSLPLAASAAAWTAWAANDLDLPALARKAMEVQ